MLVVGYMALPHFVIGDILGMPDGICGLFQIGGSLTHRVFVISVEARFVDQIDDGFFGIPDGQCGVGSGHCSVCLHSQHGAEVDAFHGVACGVASHGELVVAAFHLVWNLRGQGQLAVDVASQSDGDELVGLGGDILSGEGTASTHIAVSHQCTVQVELSPVLVHSTFVMIYDVKRTQGLVELRVVSFYMQL